MRKIFSALLLPDSIVRLMSASPAQQRHRAGLGCRIEREHAHQVAGTRHRGTGSAAAQRAARIVLRNSAASGDIAEHRTRRHRLQKHPSIGLGLDARIAEHDHAEIVEIADQPPDALLQCQHRLRQLIFEERIAAAPTNSLESGFQQRIVGCGERQLIDRDDGERVALDVHAFPKTARGQQHRIAKFSKAVEQGFARRLALHQHRKRRIGEARLQRPHPFRQTAIAGVEQERAAAAGLDERRAGLDEFFGERGILRIRHARRQKQPRLVAIIEGTVDAQRARVAQSDPLGEM